MTRNLLCATINIRNTNIFISKIVIIDKVANICIAYFIHSKDAMKHNMTSAILHILFFLIIQNKPYCMITSQPTLITN